MAPNLKHTYSEGYHRQAWVLSKYLEFKEERYQQGIAEGLTEEQAKKLEPGRPKGNYYLKVYRAVRNPGAHEVPMTQIFDDKDDEQEDPKELEELERGNNDTKKKSNKRPNGGKKVTSVS